MRLVVSLLLVLLTACTHHSGGAQVSSLDGKESSLVVNPILHGDQQRIAYIHAIWTFAQDGADSIEVRPSPFSPPTGPSFLLSETGEVLVEIHDSNDLLIYEVFRGILPAGYYVVAINTKNMDPGQYILKIHYDDRVEEKEIVR